MLLLHQPLGHHVSWLPCHFHIVQLNFTRGHHAPRPMPFHPHVLGEAMQHRVLSKSNGSLAITWGRGEGGQGGRGVGGNGGRGEGGQGGRGVGERRWGKGGAGGNQLHYRNATEGGRKEEGGEEREEQTMIREKRAGVTAGRGQKVATCHSRR
ncbi:unnamed protein product [Closterium sp. NIES-54]